ncbi:MAG TPA: SDR family NAD(P)-dependent oxidoreductase [Chitinophagaceae bacterium]|nr:SDR family NAD(P)-dependent oxidoreductase [Chitinophagaceae bacterium]
MSKVIFITGASRGFGKTWAEEFLKRGDSVAATARDITHLNDLVKKYSDKILPIQLDVNSREADFAAVQKANRHFGRIDVLINNAGYGLFGAIEETTEQEARDQIEVNVFGLLWLTQAIIPIMREQGFGHIINMSSFLGLVSVPNLGLYNASKHAVEGLTETLAAEVSQFGIKVSLVEPNAYSTDWASASAIHTKAMPAYDALKRKFSASLTEDFFGDPIATNSAILQLVDAENPPLHFLLGKIAYPYIKSTYQKRFAEWDEWNDVAVSAHGK